MKTAATLSQKQAKISGVLTWVVIASLLAIPLAERTSQPDLAVKLVLGVQAIALLGILGIAVQAGSLRKSFVGAVIAAVAGALLYGRFVAHS